MASNVLIKHFYYKFAKFKKLQMLHYLKIKER